ncbi:outer membrane beta-barrel protein [Hyphobacterium sp. CCMP332]|nr:outer membrane beta-barrel protein [Hyphobacterium sp. CCMP332]
MKLLLSALIFFFMSNAVLAQSAGEMRVSAGLAIGTEAGLDNNGGKALGLGINIGGEYFIVDNISASPSFTYFFESNVGTLPNRFSLRLNTLNIDGRYYLMDSPVEFYGIAGISIASARAESNVSIFGVNQVSSSSDSEVGLNFGIGANLPVTDEIQGNAQMVYNTPLEQLIINLGVVYRIF